MSEAKDPAAPDACATLEQVDSAATLIAVGRQLRIPEDPESGHVDEKYLALPAVVRISSCRSSETS